jgi:hypothetical protein
MLFSVDILLYVVQCRYSTVCCSVSIFYCMLFSVDILLYVLCLHVALLSFHCYDYVCVPMSERVSMSNIVLTLLSICSTISWREQFTFYFTGKHFVLKATDKDWMTLYFNY